MVTISHICKVKMNWIRQTHNRLTWMPVWHFIIFIVQLHGKQLNAIMVKWITSKYSWCPLTFFQVFAFSSVFSYPFLLVEKSLLTLFKFTLGGIHFFKLCMNKDKSTHNFIFHEQGWWRIIFLQCNRVYFVILRMHCIIVSLHNEQIVKNIVTLQMIIYTSNNCISPCPCTVLTSCW